MFSAYARPAGQQNSASSGSTTSTTSPANSAPPTPVTPQPQPTTPVTPVFPGMVPAQSPATPSPAPNPLSSVIRSSPAPAGSPQFASNHSGHSTPTSTGLPPTDRNTPSIIRVSTPSGTPGIPPPPYGASRSGTPTSRGTAEPSSQNIAHSSSKGFLPSADPQLNSANPKASSNLVMRSYTPSGAPHGQSSPMQGPGTLNPGTPVAHCAPSPKPNSGRSQAGTPNSSIYSELPSSSVVQHSGGSGSNSPVPSAFKGPSSRSGTPSLSSLVMPNSAALARSLGLNHSAASPLGPLASQHVGSPVSAFPGISSYSPLSSASPLPGVPSSMHASVSAASAQPTTAYSGLDPTRGHSPSPFGLGLTNTPSMFPGLASGQSPAFSGYGGSGPAAAGSPVLSSFMGLPGVSSSVATVAPLQAAAVAAAAAAGVPSTSPVLPGFASAFSSNFNPALVGQPG